MKIFDCKNNSGAFLSELKMEFGGTMPEHRSSAHASRMAMPRGTHQEELITNDQHIPKFKI